MKHTLEMKYNCQRLVSYYIAYLCAQLGTFGPDRNSPKFFVNDFYYGFKGRSLLPMVFACFRGLAFVTIKTVQLDMPNGYLEVLENGDIENHLSDKPGWFDMVEQAGVTTDQYILYLVSVLQKAIVYNNQQKKVHDDGVFYRFPLEEIEKAFTSRGIL